MTVTTVSEHRMSKCRNDRHTCKYKWMDEMYDIVLKIAIVGEMLWYKKKIKHFITNSFVLGRITLPVP